MAMFVSGSSTSTGSFGKAEVSTIKLGGTEVIATAAEINYLDGVVSDVKEALKKSKTIYMRSSGNSRFRYGRIRIGISRPQK